MKAQGSFQSLSVFFRSGTRAILKQLKFFAGPPRFQIELGNNVQVNILDICDESKTFRGGCIKWTHSAAAKIKLNYYSYECALINNLFDLWPIYHLTAVRNSMCVFIHCINEVIFKARRYAKICISVPQIYSLMKISRKLIAWILLYQVSTLQVMKNMFFVNFCVY